RLSGRSDHASEAGRRSRSEEGAACHGSEAQDAEDRDSCPGEGREGMTIPDWLEPMAATLTAERFGGSEWTFERKLDGVRLLAFKNGKDVRLLSRNNLPQNGAYPSVVAAIAALPLRDVI